MTSIAFNPEEVKKGLLQDLLDYLFKHNQKSDRTYYDIHIYQEENFVIVEYENVYYNEGINEGKFIFVKENEVVMREIIMPDNTHRYALDEEEEKEIWEDFHRKNPGWVKTEYGTWTNWIENQKIEEFFEKERKGEKK